MLAELCSHCMFFINWETDSWFLSSLSAQINYTYFRMRDLCKLAGWFQCGSPSAGLCKLYPGPATKKRKPPKTQLGNLPLSGKFYHSNSYFCSMKRRQQTVYLWQLYEVRQAQYVSCCAISVDSPVVVRGSPSTARCCRLAPCCSWAEAVFSWSRCTG